MFALVDKERPEWAAMRSYFRTREEAEASRSERTMHKAGGITLTGPEYLDIVEVERESRPCVFCGTEVESEKEETDFCRNCYYMGTFHEERTCKDVLEAVRAFPNVDHAEVWHTGGGCFNVAITLLDGRLLTPSIGYLDEDGSVWAEAGLPEDENDRWALAVSPSVDAWYEDYEKTEVVPELLTNEQLIERVRVIAETPA